METTQNRVAIRAGFQSIADMLYQHFLGIPPVVFDSLKKEDLRKKGCTFASFKVKRVFDETNMVKKHRETKEVNPFLGEKTAFEIYEVEVILNAIWANSLQNRGSDYKPQENRANGIQNVADSRVVCWKEKDGKTTFYINYQVVDYTTDRVLIDDKGNPIDPQWFDGFLKTPRVVKEENRQREADKHGLDIEVDPQIRQMKMSNIEIIRVFGFDYMPTPTTVATMSTINVPQKAQ